MHPATKQKWILQVSVVSNKLEVKGYDVQRQHGGTVRNLTSVQVDKALARLQPGDEVLYDCRRKHSAFPLMFKDKLPTSHQISCMAST